MTDRNSIPPITHPLGQYWRQPDRESILVDDTHALMSQETFAALPTYSSTFPTGVYPGKMWKRLDGQFDPRCKPKDHKWMLVWYGVDEQEPEKFCSNNFRTILTV